MPTVPGFALPPIFLHLEVLPVAYQATHFKLYNLIKVQPAKLALKSNYFQSLFVCELSLLGKGCNKC